MSDPIKVIPPATANNVLPPNLDHEYFKNAAAHPFRPKENSFSLVNAWWLAECALLSYANEPFVKKTFKAAIKDSQTEFFEGKQTGTQCHVT